MSKDPEVIRAWLKKIDEEGQDLTSWEQNFLTSVTEQFEKKGTLSEKQIEIVERIYSEKTS